MILLGTKVRMVKVDMPGEVVHEMDGSYQVKWEPGYESPFSGSTFWCPGQMFSLGLIEVENSVVPEAMKELPADLFENAFQLAFEL